MALVTRNGKRYRFHLPFKVGHYTITRYGPLPNNADDLLIFVKDEIAGDGIEFDEAEARQLDDDISTYQNGEQTEDQFLAKLEAWFAADLQ